MNIVNNFKSGCGCRSTSINCWTSPIRFGFFRNLLRAIDNNWCDTTTEFAPLFSNSWKMFKTFSLSSDGYESNKFPSIIVSLSPKYSVTILAVSGWSGVAKIDNWSSVLIPSRNPPRERSAINLAASSSIANPSFFAIFINWRVIISVGIGRKKNCWTRLRIVAGSLSASVVARINTTCSGGSSKVFNSALNAGFDSMWTSSMI